MSSNKKKPKSSSSSAANFCSGQMPGGKRKFTVGGEVAKSRNRNTFASNYVKTSKYNAAFLPVFLFCQFRKPANLFFLIVALLQQIQGVSPTGRFTTLPPLFFILLAAGIKEAIEEFRRRRSDIRINQHACSIVENGGILRTTWDKVRVGDILYLEENELVPADGIILSSDEPNCIVYVETANLDGETSLKIRQGLLDTKHLLAPDMFADFEAAVICDAPDSNLYAFCGTITLPLPEPLADENQAKLGPSRMSTAVPLGVSQLLLRGTRVKNTEFTFALVVYSGHDTKVMKNSRKPPHKMLVCVQSSNKVWSPRYICVHAVSLLRSNVDRIVGYHILSLFGVTILMSLGVHLVAAFWEQNNGPRHWYLLYTGRSSYIRSFFSFVVLFNTLIPISLLVTLEFVRFFQAGFISLDGQMYYEGSDSAAEARTSNLNEELGQVQYLFSDKTGTLTENKMKFRECSVAGRLFRGQQRGKFSDSDLIKNLGIRKTTENKLRREFLNLMAVCHTVVPSYPHAKQQQQHLSESHSNNPYVVVPNYQGSSPDEVALVRAASKHGFVFVERTPLRVVINVVLTFGDEEHYDVLQLLEFTSSRKRMGVIVRAPDGMIKLYVKGADTVIYQRLSDRDLRLKGSPVAETTLSHLKGFAEMGYRTLCCAMRVLPAEVYADWMKHYNAAAVALTDREAKLEAVADMVEVDLTLLGATAIEDKLQTGVPSAVQSLRKAGIKLWMLTGDKVETAINIARSCHLLDSNAELVLLNRRDPKELLSRICVGLRSQLTDTNPRLALVIDGDALSVVLSGGREELLGRELRDAFTRLTLACKVVLCCRASPEQKAEVVELIKRATGAITLAIGDGANDVAMIQAANVGVGLVGEEGLRAASAADYAIPQFRHLTKLLFVHGAWNYHRIVKTIMYSFYKNATIIAVLAWYAMWSCAGSATPAIERWLLGAFNMVFTTMAPLVLGLFDRTAPAKTMLKFPQLYKLSQDRESFGNKVFWGWFLAAMIHGTIIFAVSSTALHHEVVWQHGRTGGWIFFGHTLYSAAIFVVNVKAALETNTWVWWSHFSLWSAVLSWFVSVGVYSLMWRQRMQIGPAMAGSAVMTFTSFVYWFVVLLATATSLIADIAWKFVRRNFFKTIADEVVDLEKAVRTGQETVVGGGGLFEQIRRVVRSQSSADLTQLHEHGFAFSQDEKGAISQKELIRLEVEPTVSMSSTTT